ncbi:MAG: hypothetical protein IKW24_02305 [Clostridia bacterium]|nr:hypothetical protein [Clostridia bacterium]
MGAYLQWCYVFLTTLLLAVWNFIKTLFTSLLSFINVAEHIGVLRQYAADFAWYDWALAILTLVVLYVMILALVVLAVLTVRKYIRFRTTAVGNDDIMEQMAILHNDIKRMTKEKERLIAISAAGQGLSPAELGAILGDGSLLETPIGEGGKKDVAAGGVRFFRLNAVDQKYENYVAPEYDTSMNLEQLCEDFRYFCCSRMRLYYDIKIIRLMFAGLSSTKLILLQGISGTGKTSLPYAMGKYFQNDATIASVQPSWRDRTELFGYFNEFTKKYNETEMLKRVYESSYNDDINVIILDEMNIARVEYYFAEMLSILEMPDPNEWKLEIVSSSWPDDPKRLPEGKLQIPQNIWYVGTANNDDSTFAVSDKVYDRALVINIDSKGVAFDAPDTPPKKISYSHVAAMYEQAVKDNPVTEEELDKIAKLDMYVIQKFRVAFGNRIMKQLCIFVPVYVACGGTATEAIDYLLATKVFRKFEALNLSLIRDEIKGLINYLDQLYGKGEMAECIAYLERLRKMY